jgi:hypothetical protein
MSNNLELSSENKGVLENPVVSPLPSEISARKSIALVAHDNKKQDLLEWARYNREL